MASVLRISVVILVIVAALVTAQDEAVADSRQSEGNWLCSSWVPYGVQVNVCRFYCFFFFNRVPSSESAGGCVNGYCDCS